MNYHHIHVRRFLAVTIFSLLTYVGFSQTSPGTDSIITLKVIYDRLESGADGSATTFFEPATGPGTRVGRSTNEIMEIAPKKSDSAAISNQVLEGKHYWGLDANNWGNRSGTMPNIGAQQIIPSSTDQQILEGYHNGGGTVTGDSNLTPSNIKAGVSIFGINGTFTQDANATAEYIVEGNTAWVNGVEITGTLADPLKRRSRPLLYYIDSLWDSGNSVSGGDTIILSGVFEFPMNDIRVSLDAVPIHPGDIIDANKSRISFRTPPGSGLVDISLEINALPVPYSYQAVDSSGMYSYVTSQSAPWRYAGPVINSVSGCLDMGNVTANCPISGGIQITLTGSNFGSVTDNIEVTVQGIKQEMVSRIDHNTITFILAANPGGGENMDVTLTVNGQSVTAPYLSYSTPKLFPFDPKYISSMHGGDVLVFYGLNLLSGTYAPIARLGTKGLGFEDMQFEAQVVNVSPDAITLIAPPGCGELVLAIKTGEQYYYADGYLRYPNPIIVPGTLRGGYSDEGESNYQAPSNARTKVYFEVMNLGSIFPRSDYVSVYYGPVDSPMEYQCTNVTFEDNSTISCVTETAHGSGYAFTIKCLDAFSPQGTDNLYFPSNYPVVTSVSGCKDDGTNTIDCSTEGGTVISVHGSGFTPTTMVLAGGKPCTGVTYHSSTLLSFLLPGGIQKANVAAIDQALGNLNESEVYVDYGNPVITSVSGCKNLKNGTIDCPQSGGIELTLSGKNFGAEGGMIYAGGVFVTNISHDATHPHAQITFTLPEGKGMDRELYFINPAGKISNIFHFSYTIDR